MKSLEELLEERKKIDAQIEEAKRVKIAHRREVIIAKLDSLKEVDKRVILSLVEHGRTSCSDENVCNGRYTRGENGWRCDKCMLIEVLNGEHGSDYDFHLVPEFKYVEDM